MAQNQTQTNQTPKTAGPGRPPKGEGRNPREVALENLQYALDRACLFVHDGNTSYASRAKRAAKVGVPEETVLMGLAAIEGALADARAVVEKAYAPAVPGTPKVRESRVRLG